MPGSGRRRTRPSSPRMPAQGYRIIGTSTSCSHTFKAEYEEMLDLHDDDTKVVAQATWDICEFLLDLHEQGRLDTSFGALDADLPYHAPCQLRSHGIGFPALELFALVPGLRAEDMDHDCCGIAGTYGLKKEKYDIAMAVGAPLFDKIQATGRRRGRVRLRDLPLADRVRDRRQDPPPGRVPARRLPRGRRGSRLTGDLTIEADPPAPLRVVVVGAGRGRLVPRRDARRDGRRRHAARPPPVRGRRRRHAEAPRAHGQPHGVAPAGERRCRRPWPPTSRSSP